MKRNIFLIIVFPLCYIFLTQPVNGQNKIHIIPEPVSVQVREGHFILKPDTRIIFNNDALKSVAGLFQQMLNTPTGFHLVAKEGNAASKYNVITLQINKNSKLGDEGYTLKVMSEGILISANTPHGVFYGIQSLMQLLPPPIESDTTTKNISWNIPCVNILDYPHFKWRGLMVDESRHFFGKRAIKRFINEMARYKFNVFHWHLSDDQGWRIQIKGLPKLTEVGAWRVPRTGAWGTFKAPQPGEKATYGGYYTQQDIKDIVQYAQQRFVTILPEIDVPAHSLALIASYPDLSSTQKQYPVWPQSLSRQVQKSKGIDNVLDVANDSTWLILNKIFTQIAKLFPGEYIHVGGDEANRSYWMKDPADIALMKKEGITEPAGLQSYFEKRLEKLIISKGKKMIGWDEILEGGLAPEAAVMSWRGVKGGIKASKMGHKVVMTPHFHAYLNRYQGSPLIEPEAARPITVLKKVYHTDMLPKGSDPKFILGGEGCLWSEYIPNYRHLEYMTYPRALALSEVFWTPGDKRNWSSFVNRVQKQFKYLKAARIKYSKAIYDPMISAIKGPDDSMKIVLSTQIPGLHIYYTFDGTNPDNFYPEYKGKPLSIPEGASEIRVITYRNGVPVGHQMNCPLARLEKYEKK